MNTKVNLAGVELKNPVMTASGTFGSGAEYSEFVDLSCLGAVVTKGVASVPWPGNPTPRIAETSCGMLNAIGLQNPGIDVFCERDIPFLKKYDTKIIVNVCGKSTEEYCEVVERLAGEDVDMLEINISCPVSYTHLIIPPILITEKYMRAVFLFFGRPLKGAKSCLTGIFLPSVWRTTTGWMTMPCIWL